MDCKEFLNLLDQGENPDSFPHDSPMVRHAEACPACRKAWEAQKIVVSDLSSLLPDRRELERFSARMNRQSANTDRPVSNPWGIFDRILFRWALGFAVFLIGISLAALWYGLSPHNSLPKPAPPVSAVGPRIVISGTCQILRGREKLSVAAHPEGIPLLASDQVILENQAGKCMVSHPHGKWVAISGQGRFQFGDSSLKVEQAECRISFSSFEGYKVRMLTVILGIRGTVIHLKAGGEKESVWVEEGKIQWTTSSGGKQGFLEAGQGLTFTAETAVSLPSSPLWLPPKKIPGHTSKEPPESSSPANPIEEQVASPADELPNPEATQSDPRIRSIDDAF